jgi:hypothetical protein
MEVIKSGNTVDPATWTTELTCKTCEAHLRIDRGDLKRQVTTDMRGEPEGYYYYITCPECCTENKVKPPQFRKTSNVEDGWDYLEGNRG